MQRPYLRVVSQSYLLRFFAGPLSALIILLFTDINPENPLVTRMVAVTLWVAIWWMTEVVHLAITSLLPFLLIPMLGIANTSDIAREYMDPIMFLFIGGFILAIAIERWSLHKRIALKILMRVGKSPATVLAGVMGVSYFFSMWISNTATVLMLLAAVSAVVYKIEETLGNKNASRLSDVPQPDNKVATGLFIGLAYSATIGGMTTLVGTPPNMVFFRFYEKSFPANNDMDFANWFFVGFPISLLFLIIAYFILRFMFIPKKDNVVLNTSYFKEEYKELGKMRHEEKLVALLFTCTALLWFTRSGIDLGELKITGWKYLFPNPDNIQDGTVAIAMAMLLFFIPSRSEKGKMLMSWNEAQKLPFHILLLFGSGFALAKGFQVSGLSSWLATQLEFLKDVHPAILILALCALVTIISEFASNVASIQLMLPILLPLVTVLNVHPLLLMVPATLAASLGFMLPIATAPNTIVFGSGRIRVVEMMKAGFILNMIGVLLITAAIMLLK